MGGVHVADLKDRMPPCVRERAGFMSERPIRLSLVHKLLHDEKWKHLLPTDLDLPAYSAPALPFRWVNRESAAVFEDLYGTGYDVSREPIEGWMEDGAWVLDPENQRHCLESFWSAIKPAESLCFFYAKEVPGAEEGRRVIVGVGRVVEKIPGKQFTKGDPAGYEAWVWERPVRHSIEPSFSDGFILPYREVMRLAKSDPKVVLNDHLAYAPDECREEFSYASEHVSHDGALRALESCRNAIDVTRALVPGPWDQVLRWINARISEVSRKRGPFPGLGAALTAIGVKQGMVVADVITRDLPSGADPWAAAVAAIGNPNRLPVEFRRCIPSAVNKRLASLTRPDRIDRWNFLRLLSRFQLSCEQLKVVWDSTEKEKAGIAVADGEFVRNPYLLFEQRRHPAVVVDEITTEEDGETTTEKITRLIPPVSFWTIDRGIFLSGSDAAQHPLPAPSAMTDETDTRRCRALITHLLARAEGDGHSLLPMTLLFERAAGLKLEPACPLDADLLDAIRPEVEGPLVFVRFADGKEGIQLEERANVTLAISNLLRRARAQPIPCSTNWRTLLNRELGPLKGERDKLAREEKTAALQAMATARMSVVIGPAGSGKTKLLSAFCSDEEVAAGRVLLLAPTGKARVRMQTTIGQPAQTIAQYLIGSRRYEGATSRYVLNPDGIRDGTYKTVIVDEASMLTEDQLAALVEQISPAQRIILVGDPGQLPPIGVGRPFVDLVRALRPAFSSEGPRVATGYAELTQRMRQSGDGEDLQLADLFSGNPIGAADDQVLFDLAAEPNRPSVRAVKWSTPEELRDQLRAVLRDEFGIGPEIAELAKTLGGKLTEKGNWYFDESAASSIENWQVLAPMRYVPGGTDDLNRVLQRDIRGSMLRYAAGKQSPLYRVPKPIGSEQIVLGDKVINNANKRHRYVSPKLDALAFVANGEIGVVTGQSYGKGFTKEWRPSKIDIVFGSQEGFTYTFKAGAFREEGEPDFQLAYAVTVHKAQGSEFKRTFVVIPEHASISRELIYTALTRHREKLIILHQGDLVDLLRACSAEGSATAGRFTCVTAAEADVAKRPLPVKITSKTTGRSRYLEQFLIHTTRAGVLVQSKSEVIIANELDFAREKGALQYTYEEPLPDKDGGQPRLPDFTIQLGNGRVFLWEHCGMLGVPKYRERWARKLKWYQAQGISEWNAESNPSGRLVVTRDGPNGDIDAEFVRQLVDHLITLT